MGENARAHSRPARHGGRQKLKFYFRFRGAADRPAAGFATGLRVRAPSKDAVKHRRSMPRISSAIAGWLLVKTRSGSLPGEGSLPIGTVTALNAKTAKAPLLLYRHRWYCAPTRREAEGGTYRLRAGEAGGRIDRGARASLKSHGRRLANCDSLRARAANRLDHVTLTPGAPASAVATDTLWVSFRPQASSPRSADRRPAQVVDVTLRRRSVPLAMLKLGNGVGSRSRMRLRAATS